jgi:hypothetical protein
VAQAVECPAFIALIQMLNPRLSCMSKSKLSRMIRARKDAQANNEQ